MSLLSYEHQFANLKLNSRGGGEKSPHKVAMLLAVLELIEEELIEENRIYFDRQLKETFSKHFNALASESDRNNPHFPFFHLRSSGFWHHHVKPGKSGSYSELSTASSPSVIAENISFSYLDDELFELLGNGVARELLRSSLQRNLTTEDHMALLDVGTGWNWLECEATVQDYFVMLNKELTGQRFIKAEHRRALAPKLDGRSEGSIEFKHQNISAVLIEMGQPYIQGYKPAFNYQQQLKQVVLAHLAGHQADLEQLADTATSTVPDSPREIVWDKVLDPELPERIASIQEPKRQYLGRKTNFSERERNNRKLGERGEAFAIEFERFRLTQLGREDLAREIEWSSSERGDGLGYDVRSFNAQRDEELFIEVKTTNSGKYQPFFISENEVAFSKEWAGNYSLYRVYDFKQQARIYQLNGAVDQYVHLNPQSYKASFS